MYSLGVVLYEIGVRRCATVAPQAAPRISKRPLTSHSSNSQCIDTLLKDGSIGQLKRFAGKKYRDAVLACLKMDFDDIWEKQEGERGEKLLHTYLDQVQNKVVDANIDCSA
ncbi:hypothetical protein JMJ35_001028 [Cladonia borealis]|uniref:Uncharacterized protein n=1 Tax=Cladonia borealis TaxID=184061 RepID=A0AA39R9S5_9LECA|nr:hypothetical protein JMJ35_001028 [Cladonia borealis]